MRREIRMDLFIRVRKSLSSTAQMGYSMAGAALLVPPALVLCSEGITGVTTGFVLSALFGIGYLIAAVLD
jgi:hypothetical protein